MAEMTSPGLPGSQMTPPLDVADRQRPPNVPRWLVYVGAYGWRFLVLAATGFVIITIISRLRVVLVPIAVGLLIAAMLAPPKQWLGRHGLSSLVATLVTFASAIVAVGTASWYIIPGLAREAKPLSSALDRSIVQIQNWLVNGPLALSQDQVDQYVERIRYEFTTNDTQLIHGALSSATIAIEISISLVLTVVLAFFFVKDGEAMVEGAIGLLDERARPHARALRRRAWNALSGYVRGTAINGIVNGCVMAIGLIILDVPAVLPVAIITVVGGFFPIIGAWIAGAVAAMVALASDGAVTAMLVIALTIIVHNVEAYLVGPFVLGRAVRLSPPIVLIALTTGAAVAGVAGAALAIPVTAVAVAIISYAREQQRSALVDPTDGTLALPPEVAIGPNEELDERTPTIASV
jgi:predicted PurR-regulated permease PerM